MTEHSYSTADIELLEFDAGVRKRPGMYFGVGPGNPKLPANLLCAVARHVLHPATRVAEDHTLRGLVEITSDSRFTVTMDQPHAWGTSGVPALGYFDSLLGPEWWLLAAAAALSRRVTVEMWCAGRGLRQDLIGIRPLADPREFHPVEGSGTRVSFALDPAYVGRHFVLPTDLENLDLHGPNCLAPEGPGHVLIRTSGTGKQRRTSCTADCSSTRAHRQARHPGLDFHRAESRRPPAAEVRTARVGCYGVASEFL